VVELIRLNDPVLISLILATLEAEALEAVVLDEHTSIIEGSIGAIQRRVMVHSRDLAQARQIVSDIAPGELKE
jgi:hypothetical protein